MTSSPQHPQHENGLFDDPQPGVSNEKSHYSINAPKNLPKVFLRRYPHVLETKCELYACSFDAVTAMQAKKRSLK